MFIKIQNTITTSGGQSTQKEFQLDRNIRVLKGTVQIRDNAGSIIPLMTSLDDFQVVIKTQDKDLVKQQGSDANNSIDALSLGAFLSSEKMPPILLGKGTVLKMQTQHNASGTGAKQAVPITIVLTLMYEELP